MVDIRHIFHILFFLSIYFLSFDSAPQHVGS